jgi:hypothetical protein
MRVLALLLLGSSTFWGQICAPSYVPPAGAITGQIDGSSCLLSDSTPYAAYNLVYPVRGSIQISQKTANPLLALILRDSTGTQIASGASITSPVEAGTYTLLVDAAPGALANGPVLYALAASFTAEPGMICSNFPLLGLSQTAAGRLGVSGCKAADASLFEGYNVTTLGAGTLTVTVASSDFTPVVTVRSDNGLPVGSGPSPLSVAVPGSSAVEVVVASADTTGAYQITTSFQAASSETCLPRKAFTQSDKDQAAITASSCTLVLDNEGDQAYYNYYNVTVAAAGIIDIGALSTDFTPTLNLLDAAGNVIAFDTGGGGNGNAEVRLQLNPGNYLVQVFSNYTSGGNYSLAYTFTPGLPQPCSPLFLNPGDSPSGMLSAQSCRTALGLTDLYTVTLSAAGTLNVDLITSSLMGQIAIRDTKDNLIVLNQDLEGLGDSHITAALSAGTYVIAAAALSGAGSYQLTSSFTANPIPACPPARTLTINSGYVQTIGASQCTGADGQPLDPYTFTLSADSVVAAIMTSGDFTGDLALTDSTGALLRHDRSSYAPNDPMIVQFLPAGTYRLQARSATSSASGLYQITVLSNPGPRPLFCAAMPALAPGANVSGTLGISSCQYVDGSFADIYPVTLAADASVDIKLNSSAFDAYLLLLDAKGNLLAQDDDSGGGTNSRIVQALKAGTYYVVAKPFAYYYSVGAYTLSVAPYVPPSSVPAARQVQW